MFNKEVTSC